MTLILPKKRSIELIKVLLITAALALFVISCIKRARTDVTLTSTERQVPTAVEIGGKNYGTFSHSVPEHEKIDCDSCHRRTEGSASLEYPGHSSCIDCHLTQYTNPQTGMCSICHDDLQAVPATMKAFPASFNEDFTMKFDHGAHLTGAGRPREGCASCHLPQGAARSIPVGIRAHNNCFTCHTPESDIGSCNVCHDTGAYRRTTPGRTVFKAAFSHNDHTARQGVSCTDCHTVRAGAPRAGQVSAPVAVQHFSSGGAVSCRTCHNDRRAFGEANFANCRRCHTGAGFDLIP